MSLAREALRLSLVRALRGRTWATVLDSEAGAIDDYATEAAKPIICVYTDDGSFGDDRSEFLGGGDQSVLIEIAMTQKMQIDGDASEVVQPITDASSELAVGIIEHQVKVALADPTNPWAQIWPRFAHTKSDFKSVRGSLMRDGIRFAGRQITLNVMLVSDPKPGAALPAAGNWRLFLNALAAEDELLAAKLETVIEGNAGTWLEWQKDAALYGKAVDEMHALGLAPPATIADVDPQFDDAGLGIDLDVTESTFEPVATPLEND